MEHVRLDIIGVAESKLIGKSELDIPEYRWFGHNRLELHRNAKTGSGGLGFLVHESLFEWFNISLLDKSIKAFYGLNALQNIWILV